MGKRRYRKEVLEAIRNAERYGFELVHRAGSNSHIRMKHRENGAVIVLPSTPSRPSWKRNNEADVKRYARDGRPPKM